MFTDVPSPLQYFATLVARDEAFPLTEAAACLAQDEQPGLDLQQVLADIDALALRLRQRLPDDAGAEHRLHLLRRFFWGELGFAGNVNDYYRPGNSYLDEVLRTRRGIPISLAVLVMEIAGQSGLRLHGIGFPGHFLLGLRLPGGDVVLDPLSGRSLTAEALEEMLLPFRAASIARGEPQLPLSAWLAPATPRAILSRMLHNLREIHRAQGELTRLLAVHERLVVLQPEEPALRRDRGLCLAELGRAAPAIRDLHDYLAARPAAGDREMVMRRLADLRADGRSPA
jgi:regulator of sirC expression with transglutaminase-like and TPR domain